ncbi:MAG: ISNCY family transposase, partial [Chloroflexi bacterium]|nr:ISNCY family transposase [Chloroflexota bacterium]
MTTREQLRAMVLNRVLAQEWSQREAAEAVGLSERQIRRLLAEYEREGPKALIHGNRGRQPAHTLPAEVRERVVALARDQYAGFNHQHLTERLVDVEQLVVGRTTVRQMLLEAGLPSPRTRRPPQHRSRRERKPQAGMLLQADGSRHRWLGADGPYLTLIGGIDDATGTVPWALFREQEDAQGYMLWLWQVVEREGIPLALYVDRHGIFKRDPRRPLTLEEELAGGPLPTQFGRVLAELGITPIYALSPEAKGRVERLWGTLQDRLVSELRLAGATTREAANQVLVEFLPRFDARFAVPAAQPGSAYRPRPAGLVPEQVFCFKYTRTVTPDNTVDFAKQTLQLLPDAQRASYVRAQVEVHERLDGSLVVFYQGRCLATRPAPPSAPVLRARTGPRAAPSAHA